MKKTSPNLLLSILASVLFLSAATAFGKFTALDDTTFELRNELTTFTLKVEAGAVRLLNQKNRDGIEKDFESAYFFKERTFLPFDRYSINQEQVTPNRVIGAHLRVSVSFISEAITKKLVFRLYPGSPVLACDAYYKGIGPNQEHELGREHDVESTRLFFVESRNRHWKYEAVEFFDRTDQNNNLVRKLDIVGYQNSQYLNGNVLFVKNLVDDSSLLVLKEAPSSFSQIHHPGYDFELSKYGFSVGGIGFSKTDLGTAKWTKAYSIALAYTGSSELERISTLRSYQKAIRPHNSEWDEMVMMNNWGDRNRDSNTDEAFVKKEIDACVRLGVTHYQIDDGWQQGLSKNSSVKAGDKWDQWDLKDWEPHQDRFPNGFNVVVDYARKKGVTLGLWFAPSNANSFADWERDARVIVNLNKKYGVRYFKIDGIRLPNKLAEENLRKMYSLILDETDNDVFFNVDATAHDRGGYHFLYEYGGNIFLENRYTTFAKYYYPYQTLRNLWMLSRYVPAERFQIEFLNKWKNQENYSDDDVLAPLRVPFDYQFAVTMFAQPLAWFEGSNLPEEGKSVGKLIKRYTTVSEEIHNGYIFPIGEEPSGTGWTGFQSVTSDTDGFLMIYRELNGQSTARLETFLQPDTKYKFSKVLGEGEVQVSATDSDQQIQVAIPKPHGFLLLRYKTAKN